MARTVTLRWTSQRSAKRRHVARKRAEIADSDNGIQPDFDVGAFHLRPSSVGQAADVATCTRSRCLAHHGVGRVWVTEYGYSSGTSCPDGSDGQKAAGYRGGPPDQAAFYGNDLRDLRNTGRWVEKVFVTANDGGTGIGCPSLDEGYEAGVSARSHAARPSTP